jgi:hypothetical protein
MLLYVSGNARSVDHALVLPALVTDPVVSLQRR